MPCDFERAMPRLTRDECLDVLVNEGYLASVGTAPTIRSDARWAGVLYACLVNDNDYDPALSGDAYSTTLKYYRGLLKAGGSTHVMPWDVNAALKLLYDADPVGWLTDHIGATRAALVTADVMIESSRTDATHTFKARATAALTGSSNDKIFLNAEIGFPGSRDGRVSAVTDDTHFTAVGITDTSTTIPGEPIMFGPEHKDLIDNRTVAITDNGSGKCRLTASGTYDFTTWQTGDICMVETTTQRLYARAHNVTKISGTVVDTDIDYVSDDTPTKVVNLYDGESYGYAIVSAFTGSAVTIDRSFTPRVGQSACVPGIIQLDGAAVSGSRELKKVADSVMLQDAGQRLLRMNTTALLADGTSSSRRGAHDYCGFGRGVLSWDRTSDALVGFNTAIIQRLADHGATIDTVTWDFEHNAHYGWTQEMDGQPSLGGEGIRAAMAAEAAAYPDEYKVGFADFADNLTDYSYVAMGTLTSGIETRVNGATPELTDAELRSQGVNAVLRRSQYRYTAALLAGFQTVFPNIKMNIYRFSGRDWAFGGSAPWPDAQSVLEGPLPEGLGNNQAGGGFHGIYMDNGRVTCQPDLENGPTWTLVDDYDGASDLVLFRSAEYGWRNYQSILRMHSGDQFGWYYAEQDISLVDAELRGTDDLYYRWINGFMHVTCNAVAYFNDYNVGGTDDRFNAALTEYGNAVPWQTRRPVCLEFPTGTPYGNPFTWACVDAGGYYTWYFHDSPEHTVNYAQDGDNVVVTWTGASSGTKTFFNAELLTVTDQVSDGTWIRQSAGLNDSLPITLPAEPAPVVVEVEPITVRVVVEPITIKVVHQ